VGKFNLTDILNNASKQAASGGEIKPRPAESEIRKISVYDLVPSEDNFYSMREIEELKTAIEIAGKVLQNLVVVPLDDGKYKVISGHRRRLASIALAEEGKAQYEFVTCSVEPNEESAEDQEIRDGLNLIMTNSQREKTAWDKIEEVRYLREVLEKAKKNPRFVGVLQQIVSTVFGAEGVQADGTRDFIAKVLHTSPAQIGRYDAIIRNLGPEFTEELRNDRIGVSTAYELSGLTAEEQTAAFMEYKNTGEISIKDARERKKETAPPAAEVEKPPAPPAQPPQERREPEREPWTPQEKETPQEAPQRPAEQPEDTGREITPPQAETADSDSGKRQEEAPAPSSLPQPTSEREQSPAAGLEDTFSDAAEVERATAVLESLRDYCKYMSESDKSRARVWTNDVDALELALSYLRRGRADG
jgi:ParB family chromosome partitioning protein